MNLVSLRAVKNLMSMLVEDKTHIEQVKISRAYRQVQH